MRNTVEEFKWEWEDCGLTTWKWRKNLCGQLGFGVPHPFWWQRNKSAMETSALNNPRGKPVCFLHALRRRHPSLEPTHTPTQPTTSSAHSQTAVGRAAELRTLIGGLVEGASLWNTTRVEARELCHPEKHGWDERPLEPGAQLWRETNETWLVTPGNH